ncbi:MAG: DNA repair protein RecN [Acidobacteriota bacterium]|nr:MAG: DNA repair protein RecN [Acidobacteriota bacterium]
MLRLLQIRNIALIDELVVEFGPGLNMLTGETGSGKSIIVDSLGALTGGRVTADIIKQGSETASIEGAFNVSDDAPLFQLLAESGVDAETGDEIIIRRELSAAGRNRIFLNGQLITQNLLRRVGMFLVDIHGQGEQADIYDASRHLDMLDAYAGTAEFIGKVAAAYSEYAAVEAELADLRRDDAEKLQMLDVLRFQADEISRAELRKGEEDELEAEKRRLLNVEKLTTLSSEALSLLYEDDASASSAIERARRNVEELASFEDRFAGYLEGLETARSVIDDLASELRGMATHLEFSPERLEEIETRLAEISRLKRKYGGSVEAVLEHFDVIKIRLEGFDNSDLRERELNLRLETLRAEYDAAAAELSRERKKAAKKLEADVVKALADVALEKARFEVRFDENDVEFRSAKGTDRVEFYFSANPGEAVRPLVRVASGGEASRLMLTLKTVIGASKRAKTAVFDEVDSGIGGRVAEAVGRKLRSLSASAQVLCVTHQPQIASLADRHFVVEKEVKSGSTSIGVRSLSPEEQVEEIARMLAGERVTDEARENAKAMLASAK